MTPKLTKQNLIVAFQEMGLVASDSVIIHSALRSLGEVQGGADTVLDALLEVLTPSGNLMLPTFNYSRPLPEFFDPEATPGRTGVLPERGRIRPDAKRSLHPTHSVAVIGPDATSLIKNHLDVRAFGIGSPIDLLAQRGGKVLLLGVGQTSNSTIHVAEEHAGIPKAAVYDPLPVVPIRVSDNPSDIIKHRLDSSPSCSTAFDAAAHTLRRNGAIQDARIAGAKAQLMRGQEVIKLVAELLAAEPAALLCTAPNCATCPGTRRNLTEIHLRRAKLTRQA